MFPSPVMGRGIFGGRPPPQPGVLPFPPAFPPTPPSPSLARGPFVGAHTVASRIIHQLLGGQLVIGGTVHGEMVFGGQFIPGQITSGVLTGGPPYLMQAAKTIPAPPLPSSFPPPAGGVPPAGTPPVPQPPPPPPPTAPTLETKPEEPIDLEEEGQREMMEWQQMEEERDKQAIMSGLLDEGTLLAVRLEKKFLEEDDGNPVDNEMDLDRKAINHFCHRFFNRPPDIEYETIPNSNHRFTFRIKLLIREFRHSPAFWTTARGFANKAGEAKQNALKKASHWAVNILKERGLDINDILESIPSEIEEAEGLLFSEPNTYKSSLEQWCEKHFDDKEPIFDLRLGTDHLTQCLRWLCKVHLPEGDRLINPDAEVGYSINPSKELAKLRAAGDLLYMLFSSDYRRRKPVPSEFLDFDTLPAPESERPIGDHQNGNELSHSGLKSSIPSQLEIREAQATFKSPVFDISTLCYPQFKGKLVKIQVNFHSRSNYPLPPPPVRAFRSQEGGTQHTLQQQHPHDQHPPPQQQHFQTSQHPPHNLPSQHYPPQNQYPHQQDFQQPYSQQYPQHQYPHQQPQPDQPLNHSNHYPTQQASSHQPHHPPKTISFPEMSKNFRRYISWFGSLDKCTSNPKISLVGFRLFGDQNALKSFYPGVLSVKGRISMERLTEYLKNFTKAFQERFVTVCLYPKHEDDKEHFLSFFKAFQSRGRCAVIGSQDPSVKDFFLFPVSASDPCPSFLLTGEMGGVFYGGGGSQAKNRDHETGIEGESTCEEVPFGNYDRIIGIMILKQNAKFTKADPSSYTSLWKMIEPSTTRPSVQPPNLVQHPSQPPPQISQGPQTSQGPQAPHLQAPQGPQAPQGLQAPQTYPHPLSNQPVMTNQPAGVPWQGPNEGAPMHHSAPIPPPAIPRQQQPHHGVVHPLQQNYPQPLQHPHHSMQNGLPEHQQYNPPGQHGYPYPPPGQGQQPPPPGFHQQMGGSQGYPGPVWGPPQVAPQSTPPSRPNYLPTDVTPLSEGGGSSVQPLPFVSPTQQQSGCQSPVTKRRKLDLSPPSSSPSSSSSTSSSSSSSSLLSPLSPATLSLSSLPALPASSPSSFDPYDYPLSPTSTSPSSTAPNESPSLSFSELYSSSSLSPTSLSSTKTPPSNSNGQSSEPSQKQQPPQQSPHQASQPQLQSNQPPTNPQDGQEQQQNTQDKSQNSISDSPPPNSQTHT